MLIATKPLAIHWAAWTASPVSEVSPARSWTAGDGRGRDISQRGFRDDQVHGAGSDDYRGGGRPGHHRRVEPARARF
jgi:hypothetical protein